MATVEIEPQHMVALRRANEIRLAGCVLKREIAAGDLTAVEALDDPRAAPLPIFDVFMAQRRWGRDRTLKLFARLVLPESKRVRDLTDRQRRVIVEACSS